MDGSVRDKLKLKTRATSLNNGVQLSSWRSGSGSISWRNCGRWLLSGFCALTVIAFLWITCRPLTSKTIRFLLVADQLPLTGSAKEMFDAIEAVTPAWQTRLCSDNDLDAALDEAGAKDVSAAIIVYSRGVPVLDGGRVHLYTGGQEKSNREHSIGVSELLDRLSDRKSPTLLLLDVAFSQPLSVVDTPELAIWMLQREIDACFKEHPNPNMAVIVQTAMAPQSLLSNATQPSSLVESVKKVLSGSGGAMPDAITMGTLLEWLENDRPQARSNNSEIRTVFAANCDASFHSIPLLPVRVAKLTSTDKSLVNQAKVGEIGTSASDQKRIQEPTEAAVSLVSKQIVAPSPAAAIRLYDLGIETAQLESARSLVLELKSLCEGGFEPVFTDAWMRTADEKYPHWPLVKWIVSVLKSDMRNQTKADLILAKLHFDELVLDWETRQTAPAVFEEAFVALAVAERSLFSPVVKESEHYIEEQAKLAAESFDRLIRVSSILKRSRELSEVSSRQLSNWVSCRVRARSDVEDSLFELLEDHIALNAWGVGAHNGGLESSVADELCHQIEANQKRLDEYLKQKPSSSGTGPAARRSHLVEVEETTSALLATKIRISRLVAYMKWLAQTSQSKPEETLSGLLDGLDQLVQAMHSDTLSTMKFQSELDVLRQRSLRWIEGATKELEAQSCFSTPEVQRQKIIHELAQMMVRLGADASPTELRRQQIAYERCCKLAELERLHFEPWPYPDDTLIARVLGSIEIDDEAIVQILVEPVPSETECDLEIEYDASSLALEVLGSAEQVNIHLRDSRSSQDSSYRRYLTSSATKQVASHASTAMPEDVAIRSSGDVSTVRMRRVGDINGPISLNIRRIGNSRIERLAVPLEVAGEMIVDIRWDTRSASGGNSYSFLQAELDSERPSAKTNGSGANGSGANAIDWIVHSNQQCLGKFWASSKVERSAALQFRLLAMENRPVPSGSVSKSSADQFLDKSGKVSVIADAINVTCSPNAYSEIKFPAKEIAKDQPLIEFGQLVCEITDLQSQSVQFAVVRPTVIRPTALVEPQVSYDAQGAFVDLHMLSALIDSNLHHTQELLTVPVLVKCELFDPRTQARIAETQFVWDQRMESSIRLSTARATGPVIGLRITINEWPSSFVYQFPVGTSANAMDPTLNGVALSILCDASQTAFHRGRTPMAIGIWSDISDSTFRYGQDVVRVGVDKERDRTLKNNEFIEVNTPVSAHFQFVGISPLGDVKIASRVQPKQILLPTEWLVEGRYDVLAELVRDEVTVGSEPLQIVVDDTAPQVDEIRVVSSLPAAAGKPVTLQMLCSDFGLSGVTGVRVGWARNGLLSMDGAQQICVAQENLEGIWSVQIPTDALIPGVQTLLVQAEDRVGNVSDVRTLNLSVLTEEQIAVLAESKVGAVIGRVQYVKLPVPNIKVSLKQIHSDSAAQKGEVSKSPTLDASSLAKNAESKDISKEIQTYSVQTDAEGRFAFPAVRKGQYELVVEGLYRGTKRTKSVTLNMVPPSPTYVDAIRID